MKKRTRKTKEHAEEIASSETINKILPDDVVKLFIGQYVKAAKDRVAKAQTGDAKWRILRAVCGDLAELRKTGHQSERLELWKQRLKLDIEFKTQDKEELLIEWAKKHPELARKLFPRVRIGEKQKEAEVNAILGLAPTTPAQELRDAIHDVLRAREALGIPADAPLPTRAEADAEWRKWDKEHGEEFKEQFEAERIKEQKDLNPGMEIEEIDAAVEKTYSRKGT